MAKEIFRPLLALVLLVLLASCARDLPDTPDRSSPPAPGQSTPQSPPESPHLLTLAAYPEQSFHPVLTTSRVNLTLAPLMYEGLFQLDAAFQPQKLLCQEYTTSEDGLVWTFTLLPDAVFSDGTPLTAGVCAQALELARSAGSNYAGRFSCVSSIASNSAGALVITLRQPNTQLPALLDIPICLGSGDRPLGTGPYLLAENGEGALYLERRTGWRQDIQLPAERILLHAVTRADDLIYGFDGGDISLLSADLTATNSLAYSGSYEVTEYSTTDFLYLGFNTARGIFRTAAARQAVAAVLDRDVLVSTVYAGHADAALLPVHPYSPLYDRQLAGQLSPPEDTQAVMEQARISGRAVTLAVNSENSYKVSAAQLIARQLEDAGLTVSISKLSWDDYLAALAGGEFDLYLAETVLTADFDLTALVGSAGTLNYSRFSSAELDALLGDYLGAPEAERGGAANALYAYLLQETPFTPLCFKNGSLLSQWGRLSGLSPVRGNVFYQIENWTVQ